MAKKDKSAIDDTADPKSPVIDLEASEVMTIEPDPEPTPEVHVSEPEMPPAPPARPASRSSVKWWGGAALVALAMLGGAYFYKSYGAAYWPTDEMTALVARVDTLESANKTLGDQLKGLGASVDQFNSSGSAAAAAAKAAQSESESAVQASASAQQTASELAVKVSESEARIAATQKTIDALKAAITTAGANTGSGQSSAVDAAALADLSTRLDAVERDLAVLNAKGPTASTETVTVLSRSLADLKAKIAAGAPYQDDLQRIAGLVPAAPGIETLQASAQDGVATSAMLAEEAKILAGTLKPLPVETSSDGSAGYWNSIVGALSSFITVRNIGDTDWSEAARKASEAAGSGNLRDALAAIPGQVELPNELRVWRDKAQARINADAAIEEVSQAVLRQIAATGTTP